MDAHGGQRLVPRRQKLYHAKISLGSGGKMRSGASVAIIIHSEVSLTSRQL